MSTIGCNEFVHQLDSWMEGERPPDARAHARDCASCRSFAADLDAIQGAAPTLTIADPEPPARVWIALRAQLEREGLIRDGVEDSSSVSRSWLAGLFTAVPRPALAGAYLALLITVAFGLVGPFALRTGQATAFPFSTQLDNAEQTTFSSFAGSNSTVSTTLHHNLAIVDNYIALCEESVREEPDNSAARDYLYQAYQQKADLLAVMTERGDSIR